MCIQINMYIYICTHIVTVVCIYIYIQTHIHPHMYTVCILMLYSLDCPVLGLDSGKARGQQIAQRPGLVESLADFHYGGWRSLGTSFGKLCAFFFWKKPWKIHGKTQWKSMEKPLENIFGVTVILENRGTSAAKHKTWESIVNVSAHPMKISFPTRWFFPQFYKSYNPTNYRYIYITYIHL